jgi:hypothetical protein
MKLKRRHRTKPNAAVANAHIRGRRLRGLFGDDSVAATRFLKREVDAAAHHAKATEAKATFRAALAAASVYSKANQGFSSAPVLASVMMNFSW